MIVKFLYFGQSQEYRYFAETRPFNIGIGRPSYWTFFYAVRNEADSITQSEFLGTLAISEIQYNDIYSKLVAFPRLVGALAIRTENHFAEGHFNGVIGELDQWLYDVSHDRRIGAIEVNI